MRDTRGGVASGLFEALVGSFKPFRHREVLQKKNENCHITPNEDLKKVVYLAIDVGPKTGNESRTNIRLFRFPQNYHHFVLHSKQPKPSHGEEHWAVSNKQLPPRRADFSPSYTCGHGDGQLDANVYSCCP